MEFEVEFEQLNEQSAWAHEKVLKGSPRLTGLVLGYKLFLEHVTILMVRFPGLPGSMDFVSNWEKVRIRHPALHGAIYLHPKTGLARHPVMGMYHLKHQELSGLCFLLGCPGLGNSWGNLAVLPASKEADSPSQFCSVLCVC